MQLRFELKLKFELSLAKVTTSALVYVIGTYISFSEGSLKSKGSLRNIFNWMYRSVSMIKPNNLQRNAFNEEIGLLSWAIEQ